jgi:hypothetical protein
LKKSLPVAVTAAALLVLALAPRAARATMVVEKPFADLCREADLIFAGKVTSVASRWRDERRQSIETAVTFAVTDAVIGVDGSEVQLVFAGGEMDGIREAIGGIPEFRPGEEVVLFAVRRPSLSPIVGFHQGCFRVVDGRVSNVDGAPVTGVSERGLALGQSDAGERGVPLAQFLAEVRQRLADRDGGSH